MIFSVRGIKGGIEKTTGTVGQPTKIYYPMEAEHEDFDKELWDFEQQTNDSIHYGQSLGLTLPDVVLDKSDWLTISRYAERHGLTTQVLTNWIEQGVIPADCVVNVPELNDLTLLKDQSYR